MKRLGWYTLVVLSTITVLILLWQLRQALVLFLLSLAVAAAIRPMIEYLIQRGLPRGIALILSYGLVVGFIATLFLLTGNSLIRDIETASNWLAVGYERITLQWPESGTKLQRNLAERFPPPQALIAALSGEQGTAALKGLLGVTAGFFGFLANIATILILSLYWSADYVRFERLWLSLIPVDKRTRARDTWRAIEGGIGAYIRSELVQSVLAGLLLWVGYRAMGLSYPTLIALLGALAWLIPWFGGFLAIIPPLLVGLGISIPMGIIAALYTGIVLAIMEIFIEPRFFTRRRYSSVILVLVLLALAEVFGLIGFVLAPLVAAAIQISIRHLAQPTAAVNVVRWDVSETSKEIDALQERLAQTQATINSRDVPPSPEMVNLMGRLDRLFEKTHDYFTNGTGSTV
jgi:predicted PurR-regulated permease PerM